MSGSDSSSPVPRRRATAALVVLSVGWLAWSGPLGSAAIQDRTAPFPRHGAFIGRAECVECHEAEEARILAGAHAPAVHAEIFQSCETCHGPAKAHADDADNSTTLITFPPKLGIDAQKRLCGRCHATAVTHHRGDLEGFVRAGKKCTSCHEVHAKKKPAPFAGLRFATRESAMARARPVGAQKCIECHPLRNELLDSTGHASLMAHRAGKGCETCHGNGSLHVETGGLARLVTRPDVARDGPATCRGCHAAVDATEFHWKDRHKPLLNQGMTCATCHTVHQRPPPVPPRDARPENHERPTSRPSSGAAPRRPMASVANVEDPGNGLCAKCHAPAFGVLASTIHESLAALGIPLSRGCGACHPGSLDHARHAGRKQLVLSMRGTGARTQQEICAKCHAGDHALAHSRAGAHFRNEVTCLHCHSPAARKDRVREDASRKCVTCHAAVASEFRLPNHHPVSVDEKRHGTLGRGTMACVDCHEPHGARPRIRDRQLREAVCVKCHKQFRGPFVFAHQASRTQGCVACHSPHGSTNRRMLEQHTSRQNCLRCHADFPSFHDQTKGAVFTDCLKCHTEVHGSNHSRYLFR